MDQLDIAVHNTAHGFDGGVPALAKLMGKGDQVLRNKCNPNNEDSKLTLREALAMMLITGDVQILEGLAAELGYQITPVTTEPGMDLFSAVLKTASECGDVPGAIQEAMSDGRITPRELHTIITEISQARDSLCQLEASVRNLASLEQKG